MNTEIQHAESTSESIVLSPEMSLDECNRVTSEGKLDLREYARVREMAYHNHSIINTLILPSLEVIFSRLRGR